MNNLKTCVSLICRVDLNFGCPDKTVCKNMCGAKLIHDPTLAKEVRTRIKSRCSFNEIILACKEAGEGKFPVSVKTRIGFSEVELETWVPNLLEAEPSGFIPSTSFELNFSAYSSSSNEEGNVESTRALD